MVELQLVSNLLSGTLPSSINGLKNLRRLELWNNHLTGELPKTIEDLNSLYSLMLSGNQLTKEALPVSARPGEEITYRLTISATEGTASFALTDAVPLSMTLSETPSSPATEADGHIYYGGTVTAGAPVVIQYKAHIDSTVAAGRILQSQVLVTLEAE